MTRAQVAAAAAACLLAAGGCAARDTIATSGDRDDDLNEYCSGDGPPVLVDDGDANQGVCAGDLAEDTFRYAVCACGPIALNAPLITDGFDSRIAPYAPGGLGGAVGANAGFDATRGVDIGGDLIVGGAGIEGGDHLRVAGDLDDAGQLGRPSTPIEVVGSARIGGTINVGSLTVGGTLTTPPGTSVTGTLDVGARAEAAVAVPLPCGCDDDQLVDVSAIVAAHQLQNHDDEIDLDPAALDGIPGDASLELPCGRFYLDRIRGAANGTVTIRATGRTALFIGDGIQLQQDLVLEVAPGAELDVFVDGAINVAGYQRLGDPARPSRLRIYVAMSGSINLSAGTTIAGNLYAPRADLALSAPLEAYGALVIGRINGAGEVRVHYDRAVAVAGDDCVE